MTVKRFTMVCMGEDLVELNDNGIYKVFNDIGLEKLLNEQHETIQRLKQNIDELLFVDIEEELLNENEQLKKQMQRLYNYFEDWHKDEIGGNQFSEMWDNVKEDKDWELS